MIKWRWRQTGFAVSVWFPAMCLYLLYTDLGNVTLIAITAALVHEIGHMIALCICGTVPRRVVVSAFGVRFEMDGESVTGSYRKDGLVALAGPLVNGSCALLLCRFHAVASQVHLALGIWNLLPLYPLDGERVLRAWLSARMPPLTAERCLKCAFWISWGLCFGISAVTVWYKAPNPTVCLMTVYTGLAAIQRDRVNESVV